MHWLHRESTFMLEHVNLIHQVVDGECLRVGFHDGTFLLLLFRDRRRTTSFLQHLESRQANAKLLLIYISSNFTIS